MAGQRCQLKLSRPHIEVRQSLSPGILRMRISPWLWFRPWGWNQIDPGESDPGGGRAARGRKDRRTLNPAFRLGHPIMPSGRGREAAVVSQGPSA